MTRRKKESKSRRGRERVSRRQGTSIRGGKRRGEACPGSQRDLLEKCERRPESDNERSMGVKKKERGCTPRQLATKIRSAEICSKRRPEGRFAWGTETLMVRAFTAKRGNGTEKVSRENYSLLVKLHPGIPKSCTTTTAVGARHREGFIYTRP